MADEPIPADPEHDQRQAPRAQRGQAHRRLVAGGQLPVGRADLPDGQPAAARAAAARAREAAAARPLGHDPGTELRLRPPQPGDHGPRPGHDVRHRPRPRRPRARRLGLARGHLQRGLPGHRPRRATGCRRLFRQFSFPGGIPSHVAPETPGSIHEGGELGYALSHAYGAAFDNPDLVVAAVVGDGEAETGPLATSWHSNKFVDPRRDGAVLPILHLNGYKIANPTVLARIAEDELLALHARLRPHAVRRRRVGPGRDAPGVRRHARPLPRRDRATSSRRRAGRDAGGSPHGGRGR